MTLRARIFLHYSLLLVGLILIGIYTDHRMDDVSASREVLLGEWRELDETLSLSREVNAVFFEAESGNLQRALERTEMLRSVIDELSDFQSEQHEDPNEPFAGEEASVLRGLRGLVDDLEQALLEPDSGVDRRALVGRLEARVNQFHDIAREEMSEAIELIDVTEQKLDALMWVWLFAFLIAMVMGVLTMRRHVIQPLGALRDGAAAVREREFTHRVNLKGRDEMREVAEAFNRMSEELGTLYESLETKVQKQAQDIERSSRLATIGTLASGVAHEINNPLEAIGVRAEGMRRRAGDEDLKSGLTMIIEEVARSREIVRRLLDFARQRQQHEDPTPPTKVDLAETLKGAHELLTLRGGPIPEVTFDMTPIPLIVMGQPTALRQVFVNLLLNACDATTNDGKITVRVRKKGMSMVVEVEDNGEGIAPGDVPHLFDPFHTTKGTEGTGLGLSVSHGIVLDHGGSIEISSEGIGKGTLARVTLPIDGGTSA